MSSYEPFSTTVPTQHEQVKQLEPVQPAAEQPVRQAEHHEPRLSRRGLGMAAVFGAVVAGMSANAAPAFAEDRSGAEALPEAISRRDIARTLGAGESITTTEKARSYRGIALFEGDSITAWYNNNEDSPMQGWWSKLADRLQLKPNAQNAQGRSGLTIKGDRNPDDNKVRHDGTTFMQRLPRIKNELKRADIFVVEGGPNDGQNEDTSAIREAALRYFGEVAEIRDKAGKSRDTVFVLSPYAKGGDKFNGKRIPAIYQEAAEEFGFVFVNMQGVLHAGNTVDMLHPNAKGSDAIADSFMRETKISKRIDDILRA
jgi:lysophospholipase L1-like esterase